MPELILIHKAIHPHALQGESGSVRLAASRSTLTKRRWRGVAQDGKVFGFDLDAPLGHGIHFHTEGATRYVLEQLPEEVLEIPVTTLEAAARVAWNLGNLHFGAQVLPGSLRVMEDPAVIQFLSRESLPFQRVSCIFLPLSAGAHHHDHSHHHE
jgi:urease accessory protein UreE